MKLNITYNGQTISVADGKSLTLKCKDLKARGNIMVSAVADVVEPEMQTLTVVNSHNPSETATFTMPSGWTFSQFIGSEYDVGNYFENRDTNIYYKSYRLTDDYGERILDNDLAQGTFYYASQAAMQTLIIINSNNESETATFTMPYGYTFEQFVGSEYDTSDGKFTLVGTRDYDVHFDGKQLHETPDETVGGVTSDYEASGTFYYAGESAPEQTYTLSGSWLWNEVVSWTVHEGSPIYDATINFTSNNVLYDAIRVDEDNYDFDCIVYNNYTSAIYNPVYNLASDVWLIQSNRAIDFGSSPQEVSKLFYEWFTANAVKQETYTLSGTWLFNSTLTAPEGYVTSVAVDFESNNNPFFHIYVDAKRDGVMQYWGPSVDVYTYPSEWTNEAYRTITFDGVQIVSKEFYEWFMANAQFQLPIGDYIFKNELDNLEQLPATYLNFASSTESYQQIYYESSLGTLVYYDGITKQGAYIKDYGWTGNGKYQKITIANTQLVSAKFYEWFIANILEASN